MYNFQDSNGLNFMFIILLQKGYISSNSVEFTKDTI